MSRKVVLKCKRFFKPYVNIICRVLGNMLKQFEKAPCVIMYVDGGISSQVLRVGKGKWFENHGMKVKYDIQWYETNGKDSFGVESRKWRLSKCFPNTQLDIATKKEIQKYRRLYSTEVQRTVAKFKGREEKLKAPLYISMYDFDYLVDFKYCASYFQWSEMENVLSESVKRIAEEIREHQRNGKKVIGVHVRRGDMIVTGKYWKVLTPKYFHKAINMVATENSILYFFSNGFDFVKSEILPEITNEYRLIDGENQDYEDVYLYSLCNVQIGSQGSWGIMSFCFNKNSDRLLVTPNYDEKGEKCERTAEGVIYLPLDEEMYIH